MASTLRKTLWKNFDFDEVVESVNRELELDEKFSRVSGSSKSSGDWQSLVHTLVLQEKGTKTCESAFCGETVRKFSGRKLLQSHSWARGHESVVSDGSVERPHHFFR